MLSQSDRFDFAAAMWRKRRAILVMMVVAIVLMAFLLYCAGRQSLAERLVSASPFTVANDPVLVHFAVKEAEPLYAAHCASCHGANMHGNTALGAPNLTDAAWMYGEGEVFEIERTIMFGIRDARIRTRDVTEMPAYGQRGLLTPDQIQYLIQYILTLNHRPHDPETVPEGEAIYFGGVAACFDCHGSDARGSPDYGAPDLTANAWAWGGAPADIYRSIYYGRHGTMPGWLGTLSLEQIRSLAVYVNSQSRPSHRSAK